MRHLQLWMLALAGAVPALAQATVDQVLEKYAQALGGQSAYEKVTARTMKGTVEIPDDNVTGTAQVWAKAPGSYRMSLEIPGYGVIETVLDGDNGWKKDPDSGTHTMSKTDLAIAQRDRAFHREVRLKELYPKMAVLAGENLNGHPVSILEATPASGPAEKFYFDSETGLLVKQDFERITLEDGIVQYEVFYRDYKDVDGLKLPGTIEQHSPDSTMIFKFTEIKNNATLDDNVFGKPK